MHNIKKLKAWKTLEEEGFAVVTFRFNGIITGYGATLYGNSGGNLIDIVPHSYQDTKIRWSIWVDRSILKKDGLFTTNYKACSSKDILTTIQALKEGDVEIKTRYVEGKGRVPVYAGSWPS